MAASSKVAPSVIPKFWARRLAAAATYYEPKDRMRIEEKAKPRKRKRERVR
jgi:hypothetical protein